MPRKKTVYFCEICDEEHDTEQDAIDCESGGEPHPMVPGFIFGMSDTPGRIYGVTSCWSRADGHRRPWSGFTSCDGDVMPLIEGKSYRFPIAAVDTKSPDFILVASKLQKQGLVIRYYDGEFARAWKPEANQ